MECFLDRWALAIAAHNEKFKFCNKIDDFFGSAFSVLHGGAMARAARRCFTVEMIKSSRERGSQNIGGALEAPLSLTAAKLVAARWSALFKTHSRAI